LLTCVAAKSFDFDSGSDVRDARFSTTNLEAMEIKTSGHLS
jgi:hypothetical protein